MSRLLIRGGRVLDPASERDELADVLVEDGQLAAVDRDLPSDGAEVIEAQGAWVAPAFVDMHVHLGEPGREYKEDLRSGGCAGIAGGYAALACMADTDPVNDDPAVTEYILDRARSSAPLRIYPIAAATKGRAGEVMTEMVALRSAGAVAFSDDEATIASSGTMRHVLEYAQLTDAPVIVHSEDRSLVGRGVMNEGPVSTRLGLPGNPTVAEDICVARDLRLAKLTGSRLHVGHVSSAGSVDLLRRARDEGVDVTAEVTPHHLTLSDEAVASFDTNTKMSPPLRSAEDIEALRDGLCDGVIDAIATNHVPHAVHEKEVDFVDAPAGVIGLETAFAVTMELVRSECLSPLELVRRLSTTPAALLGVEGGSLALGARADVCILDPARRWVYDPAKGYSKSRNSPWIGQELEGRVTATVVRGQLVYDVDRGVLVD